MLVPMQGMACFLLERYADAQSAYLHGLSLEPECVALQVR